MRLLGLDVETTGLDTKKDYITEIGWALKDTQVSKPLLTEAHLLQIPDTVEITEDITDLTGIDKKILTEFGQDPKTVFQRLYKIVENYKVDYIVAHNGNAFDRPMLESNFDKYAVPMFKCEWLDTRVDIQYNKRLRHKNLVYLCAEHGFANPFPHAALFDVMSMMKLLSYYDIEKVIAYKAKPSVVVRAVVSFEGKDEAKAKGFSWQEAGGRKFPKQWVKQIKEDELETLRAESPFQIVEV